MEFLASGVEKHTSGKRTIWREYVTYKVGGIGKDGRACKVRRKKHRTSPVEYRETRGGEPTAKSKKEAENSAAAWLRELNEAEAEKERRGPTATRAREQTVPDFVDAYIEAAATSGELEPSTLSTYRASSKHIRKAFEGVTLTELEPYQVSAWKAQMSKSGLSPSTVGKAFRLLRMVMTDAVNKRVLDDNPTDGIKAPTRKNKSRGINALDLDAARGLRDTLEHMSFSPTVVAAMIALNTGLRQGETCGLKWRDVDTSRRLIWVRRSIGVGAGGCFEKEPKTGKTRDVAMTQFLAEYLSAYRSSLEALGVDCEPDAWVLQGASGNFVQPTYVCKQWTALSRSLGLTGTEGRQLTFHDLRHTWATLAVAAGIDIKTVSSNLGHANAAMTLNTYASADPDAKRRAGEVMDRLLATDAPTYELEG